MNAAAPERGKVLVVDDEPDILVALQDLLEDDYEVVAAPSGAAALDLLAHHPDAAVIVSDQRMPGMTGDVFLERARSISDADAILLTGYADLGAVVGALNRGRIVGYMPKPWDTAALKSMVASTYDRRRLSRELAKREALLRGLMEGIDGDLSFRDHEGRFVAVNHAKAAALGRVAADVVGHRESELRPAAVHLEADDLSVFREGQSNEAVLEMSESGSLRFLSRNRIPIAGPNGALAWLVTLERDVTASKTMELRLRQSDKLQALGTLAGGIAHDFNNLLAAILGCLELAGRRLPDDPSLVRLVRGATEAAQRGASLTRRLLNFSRQSELKLAAVDVNALLAGMTDLLEHTLGGPLVRLDLAEDLWPATIDGDQLELAVVNLCINARDAMPDGGVISIGTRNVELAEGDAVVPAGAYAVLSIADTGLGMAPEVLARVFEPFFTTKGVGKGTGLGLSMVYGLVQQAGGGIRIDSRPGEGTRVELYLPKTEALTEAPAAAPGVAAVSTSSAVIMVVDDDREVRSVTAGYLAALGHRTVEAGDGATALRLLADDARIDVLVTDYAMPGMSGVELAERARAIEPGLPVLVVTGHAAATRLPPTYRVLQKPFRQEDLASEIAALTAG